MRSYRFWIGIIVSLLFISILFYRIDLGDIVDSLRNADYIYIIPAIFLYFVSVGFRTLRWQLLLAHMKNIPLARLYPVVIVGYMANNLLPIRLGELVRSYYLGQREHISKSAGLATILVERVFDGLTLLFFLFLSSLALPFRSIVQGLANDAGVPTLTLVLAATVPFMVVLTLFLTVAYLPNWALRLTGCVVHMLPVRFGEAAMHLIERFVEGLQLLRYPKKLALVFVLSLPVWVMEAAMYYVIGHSFGILDYFSSHWIMVIAILVTTAIANLGTSIPSSPGGVGPFEFFSIATLVILGVGAPVAAAYTVVLHAVLLIPVTLAGILHLWKQNILLVKLISLHHSFG